MDNRENPKQRVLWSFPWGYKEGIFFAIGFQLVGFLLESFFPLHFYEPPRFPLNVAYILLLVLVMLLSRIYWSRQHLVVWLSSIKASIPAIIVFSFNVLLIAVIPQQYGKLPVGLHHVVRTWYFAFSVAFVLVTLSYTISKRITPFTLKNIAFTIVHFGLWLCLVAGLLGFGDKFEVKMQVERGQLVWYGSDEKGNVIELPIAIRLDNFKAEYYSPMPALMDQDGKLVFFPSSESDISKIKSFEIEQYKVSVLNYLAKAYPADSGFVDARGVPYAVPAALVKVENDKGERITGWIAPQSSSFAGKSIKFKPDLQLVLLPPEPKYFASDISLYTKSGIANQAHRIEVNSPLKVEGWYIYQYGYDSMAGADSNYSIFLVVRDPWLPIVYSGMLLVLLGTIWMSVLYMPKTRMIENTSHEV